MKIGVISDIHADLKSLQRALNILQGQQVESVVCCGDLVAKGQDGDAVIRIIQERNIPCVMGNHDYHANSDQFGFRKLVNSVYKRSLTEASLAYLNTLPPSQEFVWGNNRVLIAHGTPRSHDEYVYPYSPRELFAQIAGTGHYDAVILGHTHEPMIVRTQNTWILNPGSVCGSRVYGSATCAVLSLPSLNFHVLDIRTAQRKHPPYLDYS